MSTLSAFRGTAAVIYGRAFVTLPIPEATTDLSNHVMIVTGSNTGLGLESTRHLSRLGVGKLIMAVRNEAKGEAAKKDVLASTDRTSSSIEVWTLDMDSYHSIREFAGRASRLPRLDGVLANAGVMTTRFELGEGGVERSLDINVVATFLLYLHLLPKMRESGKKTGYPCRFAIPNSALHYTAPLGELEPSAGTEKSSIFDRLNDPEGANMAGRYPMTKLLVLYAVREFAKRGTSETSAPPTVVISTPNPSFCKSGLAQESQDSAAFRTFERVMARSTEEGSRALVHGILAGPETNGHYLNDCHVQTPACHVTNSWGQRVQSAFFDELVAKLETIQPGIAASL